MKKINRKEFLEDLHHIHIMAYHNKYPYIYKDYDSKSNDQIYQELLAYYKKYGVVNYHYYVYRLDKLGNNTDYYPYKPIHEKRLKLNGAFQEFNYIALVRDKFVLNNYFTSLSIPTPKVIGRKVYTDFEWIEKPNENCRLFFKSIESNCAKGVYAIDYLVDENLYTIDGTKKNLEEIIGIIGGKFIVQRKVEQHEILNKLYNKALNTLRVITYRENEKIKILASLFRIGNGDMLVDNWAQGGIMISIDEQGYINKFGTKKFSPRDEFYEHPDSKIKFSGFKIPFFKEALDLAKKAHETLLGIYTIGWDIAITPEGPIIIEGNDDWDLSMFQYLYGKEILEIVFPWIKDFCSTLNT